VTFRVFGLFVLLYVSADLSAASVPGIFSFASDQLFVDGVVTIKSTVRVAEPAVAQSDTSLPPWSGEAPPVAKLAPGTATSSGAPARQRPQRRVHLTAERDRSDGEPPA
jgi:hypothetical protein